MRILSFTCIMILAFQARSQDTLFIENFQPPNPAFALNTAGAGSTTSGYNHWVVNNDYAGGSGAGNVCGIPVTFAIPATASQPGAIAGSPNSVYLHMVSDLAIASGVSNCNYLAADGFCNFSESYFSEMNMDVSTVGYDTVHISFWWLCAGSANSYGELYYSTNSGVSWSQYTGMSKFNNAVNWLNAAITSPAFANQPQLRFGFRFVNNTALSASDPGFGVDDIVITGTQSNTLPIAAFSASATTFCQESCIDFTDSTANNPTSWQWFFPGAIPDTSTAQHPMQICYSDTGIFDVTLIVTNAQGTDTLVMPGYIHALANPAKPVITMAGGDTLCAAFVPGYTYQWYFNGSTLIPGATNFCYHAMFPGSYTVEVTDINGCKNLSDPVLVTGVEEGIPGSDWELVFGGGVLTITTGARPGEVLIEIFDATGQRVKTGKITAGYVRIDVRGLPAGVYILRLSDAEHASMRRIMVF